MFFIKQQYVIPMLSNRQSFLCVLSGSLADDALAQTADQKIAGYLRQAYQTPAGKTTAEAYFTTVNIALISTSQS